MPIGFWSNLLSLNMVRDSLRHRCFQVIFQDGNEGILIEIEFGFDEMKCRLRLLSCPRKFQICQENLTMTGN